MGDIPRPERVVTGAKRPALLANHDGDAAVKDVETLILGVVNVPRRVARRDQVFDDRDGATALFGADPDPRLAVKEPPPGLLREDAGQRR